MITKQPLFCESMATEEPLFCKPIEVKFRCRVCGKLTAGRIPKRGDGSMVYPRKHKGAEGRTCDGCYEEADWVKVE